MSAGTVLEPEWWTTDHLAKQMQTTTEVLSKMRQKGTGPRFTKVGRQVRYLNHDVLRWHNTTATTTTTTEEPTP